MLLFCLAGPAIAALALWIVGRLAPGWRAGATGIMVGSLAAAVVLAALKPLGGWHPGLPLTLAAGCGAAAGFAYIRLAPLRLFATFLSPATAWEHPLVEWARTATSYCSIVLDCDSRESQELACAVEAGYGDLPRPNVAAQRATSGHLHLGWNLLTPVHRGATARPRPLAALGRIAEYYAVTLRSDRGYVGVLAYNPVHGDYNTVYPRTDPYDLAELARALPAHWRRPSKPADLATAQGRNCALFAALCKLALGGSDEGLLT